MGILLLASCLQPLSHTMTPLQCTKDTVKVFIPKGNILHLKLPWIERHVSYCDTFRPYNQCHCKQDLLYIVGVMLFIFKSYSHGRGVLSSFIVEFHLALTIDVRTLREKETEYRILLRGTHYLWSSLGISRFYHF